MDKKIIDLIVSARADLFHHYPFPNEWIRSAKDKLTQAIELCHEDVQPADEIRDPYVCGDRAEYDRHICVVCGGYEHG